MDAVIKKLQEIRTNPSSIRVIKRTNKKPAEAGFLFSVKFLCSHRETKLQEVVNSDFTEVNVAVSIQAGEWVSYKTISCPES